MSADAIEAADILVTELNEQAAMLSQSGVNALSSGQISEAKVIIDAIERTQLLRGRAEQLKADIAALQSAFVPEAAHHRVVDDDIWSDLEIHNRRQDRTDPMVMNEKRNKILRQLENQHHARLHRRSAAIYRSDDNDLGVVCTMSKWHIKNENYWYAYHPHQDEFLGETKKGYFVLGMMDLEEAVAIPLDVIRQNLGKLNTTTTPDGRSYWHIHISRSRNGRLALQRARGETALPLDNYIVRFK